MQSYELIELFRDISLMWENFYRIYTLLLQTSTVGVTLGD